MRHKVGKMLIYKDRVYDKEWRVIKLAEHDEWVEYCRCFVIAAPPEDKEDLHTVMNIPEFCLESRSDW